MLTSVTVYAQNNDEFEQRLEQIFSLEESENLQPEQFDYLLQLYQSPLDINQVRETDLLSLQLVNAIQAQAIIAHRNQFGKFISIYELQSIPELDLLSIRKMLPFIRVREKSIHASNESLWQQIIHEENSFLLMRWDRKLNTPYRSPNYIGSNNRVYGRLRIHHTKDFSLGLTFEKDAGEKVSWEPRSKSYGMDYYSYHLQLRDKGIFDNIIIGDFQAQFGQSLIYGGGFNMGKSAEPTFMARQANVGLIPYTSVIESDFFRGVGFTLKTSKRIRFSQIVSFNSIDASLQADSSAEINSAYISSIKKTGFHRRESERLSKRSAQLLDLGTNVHYSSLSGKLSLGINALYSQFSLPYIKEHNRYNQYDFRGQSNTIYGGYLNYYYKNYFLFGEIAQSSSSGIGAVIGLISSISRNTQLSILFRKYEKDFHSFYGAAIGAQSRNSNENGVLVGLSHQLNRKIKISLYFDKYQHPWLKYLVDKPSYGNDFLIRTSYKKRGKYDLFTQYRYQSKERNIKSAEQASHVVAEHKKHALAQNLRIYASENLSFQTRVQYSRTIFNKQLNNGFLLAQDIRYDLKKIRLDYRFAIFETDDYDNRQYIYEKDVLYALSIPAYQNKGVRTYLLLRYKALDKLNAYVKWSQFYYQTVNTSADSNIKSDLKFQIIWRL